MPIKKSPRKAAARSQKLRVRNTIIEDRMKNSIKNLTKMKEKGEKVPAQLVSDTYKHIDKALKIGALKPNTAARRKSKIAKLAAK
ncbi:30S ribosomal protein S20 [Patescibacteria group bacterium]|jgi:ribosomal protein S20|nr:30S ribosomal protein S20 [Patescibacteria group bacterium]